MENPEFAIVRCSTTARHRRGQKKIRLQTEKPSENDAATTIPKTLNSVGVARKVFSLKKFTGVFFFCVCDRNNKTPNLLIVTLSLSSTGTPEISIPNYDDMAALKPNKNRIRCDYSRYGSRRRPAGATCNVTEK